jgi:hypothetical protein
MLISRILVHFGLPASNRRLCWVVDACGILVYVLLAVRGIPVLLEQRKEIRSLQEFNAEENRAIAEKREHIQRLIESPAEQQQEIRKGLKMQRKGEKTFILPPASEKPAAPAK